MRVFVTLFASLLAVIPFGSSAPASSKQLPKHDDLVIRDEKICKKIDLQTDRDMPGAIYSADATSDNSAEALGECRKGRNWGVLGSKLWIKRPCKKLLIDVCYMEEEERLIKTNTKVGIVSLRSGSSKVMPGPITSVELVSGDQECFGDDGYDYFKSTFSVNNGCNGVFKVYYSNDKLVGVNNKMAAAAAIMSPLAIIEAMADESIGE